jgi:hypothetical protein
MTTPILTSAQVKNLLTRVDLEKLEEQIAAGTLKAEVVNHQAIITYKNDRMALFDVLSLIGTL